ncbi:hypothetical protein [Terribacillus halophilus]|jgi:hypothetical protein|uniref:hypothetical protein n=1 Tax=Terribacillus halophilus TaxID=361279 RepID=UPI000986B251|nr:hypothetical protein [Terribacillus halophilus]
MLQIKQFIVIKPIRRLNNSLMNTDEHVCFLEGNEEKFIDFLKTNLEELLDDNLLSIDGGLSFRFKSKEYLGVEYWDDLPMIWGFLFNTLEECLEIGEGKCLFPGQPILLAMKDVGTNIQVQFDHKIVSIDRELFVKELSTHGKLFYNTLVTAFNLASYKYDLDRVNLLVSKL